MLSIVNCSLDMLCVNKSVSAEDLQIDACPKCGSLSERTCFVLLDYSLVPPSRCEQQALDCFLERCRDWTSERFGSMSGAVDCGLWQPLGCLVTAKPSLLQNDMVAVALKTQVRSCACALYVLLLLASFQLWPCVGGETLDV